MKVVRSSQVRLFAFFFFLTGRVGSGQVRPSVPSVAGQKRGLAENWLAKSHRPDSMIKDDRRQGQAPSTEPDGSQGITPPAKKAIAQRSTPRLGTSDDITVAPSRAGRVRFRVGLQFGWPAQHRASVCRLPPLLDCHLPRLAAAQEPLGAADCRHQGGDLVTKNGSPVLNWTGPQGCAGSLDSVGSPLLQGVCLGWGRREEKKITGRHSDRIHPNLLRHAATSYGKPKSDILKSSAA